MYHGHMKCSEKPLQQRIYQPCRAYIQLIMSKNTILHHK
jgi:hypothetical protein